MSSYDEIPCISHLDHPLTPPISARWEKKTRTEQLNHLYAILINGKWNDDTEEKLNELVKKGERDDVTEQQVHQLVKIVRDKEWSSKMKKLADDLYSKVMKKEWDAVIKIYKEQKKEKIQMAGITRSKHTALHIAILNKQIDAVKELLENIDPVAIREMTDNREENPLHLAVSMGQLETCKLLVKMDPELIGAENVVGETPLFLAALHGENEVFYALHPKCPITHLHIKHAKARCKRKKDGNTILHLSIRGEHFKLAYQIIHWYPDLIQDVNEDGQTALHLLAQNPSAFKSSGCYDLGPVDNFIYSCLIVDLDKVVDSDQVVDIASPVPKNYQTCLDLLNLGKKVLKLIVTCARIWEDIDSKNDDRLPVKNTIPGERQETSNRNPIQDEMSPDSSKHCQREHIGDKTEPQMGPRTEEGSGDSTPQEGHEIQRASKMEKEDSIERPQYPSNCHVFLQSAIELYHVFLHFLQSAIVLFLFVIGLGYFQVREIKAMKLKHKLAYPIMNRLVRDTKLWVYGGTGLEPDTEGAKERIPLPSSVPEDHSTEDGEKWKVIMEPIREFTKQVQEIKSGIQRKEVFLEAEKKRSDVYRFKMPGDPKNDGILSLSLSHTHTSL